MGLPIDPVEVLKDQEKRLDLALPKQYPANAVMEPLSAKGGVERLPLGVLDGNVEQPAKGREARLEAPVQGEQLAGDLFRAVPSVIPRIEVKIAPEQLDQRQVRGGLAV